jgi:hypothetical protein
VLVIAACATMQATPSPVLLTTPSLATPPTPSPTSPQATPTDQPTAPPAATPTASAAQSADAIRWDLTNVTTVFSYSDALFVVDDGAEAQFVGERDGSVYHFWKDGEGFKGELVASGVPEDVVDGVHFRPASLAIDRGSLWIALARTKGIFDGFAYPDLPRIDYATNTSGAWTRGRLTGDANEPSLVVRNGVVHFAWQDPDYSDDRCAEGEPDFPLAIHYLTNSSGDWTTSDVAADGASPHLDVAADGRARLIFGSDCTAGHGAPTPGHHALQYATEGPPSAPFSLEEMPGTFVEDEPIGIGLDGRDQAHIVLSRLDPTSGTESTWYIMRTNAGWLAPQFVLAGSPLAMAVNVDGVVNLVARDESGTLVFADNRGGSFESVALWQPVADDPPAQWIDASAEIGLAPNGFPQVLLTITTYAEDNISHEVWYGVARAR